MSLRAIDVSKSFRGRGRSAAVHAVKSVSAGASPGEFLAIVGESGSGKSTLARILLGLIPPTSGVVEIDGVDLATMRRPARMRFRRDVQAVFQDPAGSLNPRKTVGRAIDEVVRLHGIAGRGRPTAAATAEALELVGLEPAGFFRDRYPHELSGGQRQRVLIAKAVVLRPRIIVADEAVSALDASVKAGVLRVMDALRTDLGVGFVFITHDLPVVRRVADRVVVMRAGSIVEEGPTAAVFSAPRDPYTRILLDSAPRLDPPNADASRAHDPGLGHDPLRDVPRPAS